MKGQVWTPYRRLMANLVPALFFVPVFVAGVLLYQRGLQIAGVICMSASLIVGFLAVNQFGLFHNQQMMRELEPLLDKPKTSEWFVGLGKPGSVGLLDPHDDLGWLRIHPEQLEFIGEKGRYELQKKDIMGVRYRPNAHSVLGLGRWVSIEAKREGKSLRMLVEPRVYATHLRNKRESANLMRVLRAWLAA